MKLKYYPNNNKELKEKFYYEGKCLLSFISDIIDAGLYDTIDKNLLKYNSSIESLLSKLEKTNDISYTLFETDHNGSPKNKAITMCLTVKCGMYYDVITDISKMSCRFMYSLGTFTVNSGTHMELDWFIPDRFPKSEYSE